MTHRDMTHRAMTHRARAERVAATTLYEGYILYPYRASAVKNRSRFTFGSLFPPAFAGEPSALLMQCLLCGESAQVRTSVRFLQIAERGGWQEAIEREVRGTGAFRFEGGSDGERLWDTVNGWVGLERRAVLPSVWCITVRVENRSPRTGFATREQAQRCALASAHVLLEAEGGEFVSLIDPPEELREVSALCRNEGVWPVLIGGERRSDTVLASPIILYDDPQLAPESAGDLYDATEIDEILNLRVLTLTPEEKREAALDPRARAIIERAEALAPQEWQALHGTLRGLRPGQRVLLRPRPGGDVFDLALAGRVAIVDAVERDFEDRVHVAVKLEDDPGRDLENLPGHRFFFSPEELEVIA